jgi:hypothetical protein
MTVAELIKELEGMPQESIVVMSKDAEGNEYSPLSSIDPDSVYVADSTWSGDVYSTDWTAEEACMTADEWETFKREHPACVVLAPVN